MTFCVALISMASVVVILSCASARSQDFPALSEVVISGRNGDLGAALTSNVWSESDLGGALFAAAGTHNPEAARLLIASGADVDFSVLQRTPLIVSIVEDSPGVSAVLLDAGADPDFSSSFEWRPLHFAIGKGFSRDEIIRLLLAHGADIDARTNLSVTPLHRAAGFCRNSAVEILLAHGAKKNARDKYGRTAAERASRAGCDDVAALLR